MQRNSTKYLKMSNIKSEKIRILVFGSPSVGKTSMINMLTNQS